MAYRSSEGTISAKALLNEKKKRQQNGHNRLESILKCIFHFSLCDWRSVF